MKLSVRKVKDSEPATIVFDKKIEQKHLREKLSSRPGKGFHLHKHGRLFNIVFHFEQSFIGPTSGHLSFTEHELFRMVQLCRRGRSDEDFLKAIDASGQS